MSNEIVVVSAENGEPTVYWDDEIGRNYMRLMETQDGYVLNFGGLVSDVRTPFPKACIVTREQAAMLIPILQRFVDTGGLVANE